MSAVFPVPASGFAPKSGWASWRKPRPRVTFERDGDRESDWAWEAVGLHVHQPRFNWLLMAMILVLTSCPAIGLALMLLLDRT